VYKIIMFKYIPDILEVGNMFKVARRAYVEKTCSN